LGQTPSVTKNKKVLNINLLYSGKQPPLSFPPPYFAATKIQFDPVATTTTMTTAATATDGSQSSSLFSNGQPVNPGHQQVNPPPPYNPDLAQQQVYQTTFHDAIFSPSTPTPTTSTGNRTTIS